MFLALTAVLVAAGVFLALHGPDSFAIGGWVTGVVLVLAAFAGRAEASRMEGGAA